MQMKNEFLTELKALLKKYDAAIGFVVGEGSDTYGLYGEKHLIEVGDKIAYEIEGWWFDESSIGDQL